MNSAVERLLSLRVKDLMHAQVLTLEATANMRDAAQQLLEADVSGAPVIDELGRCVGVLSGTDFMLREAEGPGPELWIREDADRTRTEPLRDQTVRSHMTPFVLTVSPETPILQAGRLMCREHIHRLVVVDEEQRPVGVVSSLDLVAATVAAVEE